VQAGKFPAEWEILVRSDILPLTLQPCGEHTFLLDLMKTNTQGRTQEFFKRGLKF